MTGMANAVRQLDRVAARVARPESTDPIADRVEQITAEHDFAANVAMIRTADEMLGTLINTIA